jgi:hypothetical protein
MIALALISISMLSCSRKAPVAMNAREDIRQPAATPSAHDDSSLVLIVEATPGIPSAIVHGALVETMAIWGTAGVAIEWHLSNAWPAASDVSIVRVTLDDAQGNRSGSELPLGWINFNSDGVPDGIVHLSRANVITLIDAAVAYRDRPTSYQELLIGRALGRALAHELGHYLTASKVHSPYGLMKARRSPDELFSPSRAGFMPNFDKRQLALKRPTRKTPHTDTVTKGPTGQCDDAAAAPAVATPSPR